MNHQSQHDYQPAARRLWPHATIEGNGPFVSLVECFPNKAARLFHSEREAREESLRPCRHAFHYAGHHRVVKLQPPQPCAPFRMPGNRERDRD
jgi:hypothetical protein